MADLAGYFCWRRTNRAGRLAPSKVIADSRQFLMSSSNNQDKERYTVGLVKEVPLDAVEWGLSLDELIAMHPAPVMEEDFA